MFCIQESAPERCITRDRRRGAVSDSRQSARSKIPPITQETLASYIDERMPPLDSRLCGCQDLPGYPELWGGKK